MQPLEKSSRNFSPALSASRSQPDTLLSDIPEWDSMSSVNFKVFLEETFGVTIPDDLLEGGSTIGEVITFIGRAD